jgi:hypothetical protein
VTPCREHAAGVKDHALGPAAARVGGVEVVEDVH